MGRRGVASMHQVWYCDIERCEEGRVLGNGDKESKRREVRRIPARKCPEVRESSKVLERILHGLMIECKYSSNTLSSLVSTKE